jgi:AraC-like DNA-binding protein
MRFDFSTVGVNTSERFDYWRDIVCHHCIPASSETPHRDVFDATLIGQTIGPLTVASFIGPEHTWVRDSNHIRNGPEESLWLSYMEQGTGYLEQCGKMVSQKSGDIMLYDAAQPFTYSVTPESFYILRIPRELLRHRIAAVERLVATSLGAQTGFRSVLGSLIKEASSSSMLTSLPGVEPKVASSILDLLACVIDLHEGRGESRTVTEALYRRACVYIEKNLTNPDLSLESLAQAEKVSSRTVARVFAANGTTPMKYIWQKRLEASYCALAQGTVRKVSEVAIDYGFCDLSHFSRMFKKSFGVNPQNVLLKH